MTFRIGDIVECHHNNTVCLEVISVVHDDEKLEVADYSRQHNKGRPYDVYFCEVTRHWREVKDTAYTESGN